MNIMYASFDEVPSFKGASTHILCGLRGAVRKETVHLVTLGNIGIRPFAGLTHHPVCIREKNIIKRGLAFRREVAGLLKRIKPDLVHFRSPWEGIAAVESGRTTVYEVNGLPSLELSYYYRNAGEAAFKWLFKAEQFCLLRAASIICPSTRIQSYLKTNYEIPSATGIEVLPNAYDPVPESFLNLEPTPQQRLRLVYLGTLSPWQGIHWSLKAFFALGGRCSLDIYAPYAKQATRKLLRRIRRLGLEETVRLQEPLHRRAMLDTLPHYDLGFAPFLKTSRNVDQGCFPLKLLDYLAHGLPVLAADLAVCRQAVTEGQTATMFPPGRTASLVDKLEQACADRGALLTLRRNARAALSQHWTWEDYGKRLQEIYGALSSSASRYRSRSELQE